MAPAKPLLAVTATAEDGLPHDASAGTVAVTTAAATVTTTTTTATVTPEPAPRARRPKGPTSLAKKRTGFQHKWLSKYALRIKAVDAVTSDVLTLACRLCEKFGREKVTLAEDGTPKTKRRRTANVKLFKAPWRSDNIAHHVRDQHAHRFEEYETLTEKQKEVFLEYTGPSADVRSDDSVAAVATVALPAALYGAHANASPATLPVTATTAADATVEFFVAGSVAPVLTATPATVAPVVTTTVVPSSNDNGDGVTTTTTSSSSANFGERVVCLVDAPIVETVISDVLLDVDSEYAALVHDPAQALALFSRAAGSSGNSQREGHKRDAYLVTVPNKLEFELCLQYVALGASFRQCVNMVKEAQEKTPKGRIGSVSTANVIGFVRLAAAMNFQVLASILNRAWAFSIILDGGNSSSSGRSNERQSSYLGVRVRVTLKEQIQDFHVLTLPLYDRHSRTYLYDSLAKLLTALHGSWERKLVGIVSDGAPNLTGALSDVIAKLHQSTSEGCYRVWSGARQIELVVENLFRQLFDDAFVDSLTEVTGYLRRQEELVTAMQCECPRFVGTSWVAMGRLIDWFMAKRVEVKGHFDMKQPSCAPQASWWMLMAALKRFTDIVNNTLGKVKGLTVQIGQQRELIEVMLAELIEVGYVRGPYENLFEAAREFDLEEGQKFIFGQYYTTYHGVESLLEDLDPFVFELLEGLKQQRDHVKESSLSYQTLVTNIAYIYGESVSELSKILVERSQQSAHEASSTMKLPSVLPHELVRLSGSELNRLLRTQQQRLGASYSKEETSAIHSEHAQMKTACIRDASFKAQLDLMSHAWSFEKAWGGGIGDAYPRLRNFVGGLATAFPDACVSSEKGSSGGLNFAVLGYERSEYRSSLVDFSLEAILHCRQYPKLQEFAASMGF